MGEGALVVRVLPDVAGLGDKTFDYTLPDEWRAFARVGTLVRIALHGRRVGGWIVAVDVAPPAGVVLKPIAKVTGLGPDASVLEVAHWAGWRWAGRTGALLQTASPPGAVRSLPSAGGRAAVPVPAAIDAAADAALAHARVVVRVPPAADPFPYVLAAARRGDALVVTPHASMAHRIAARLRRAGQAVAVVPQEWARAASGDCTVVGTRAAAWAPVPRLAAAVVLDEHDEHLQQEQTPTWHARDVVIERARRAGVPCAVTSPCPTLEALAWGTLIEPSRTEERAGWPVIDVVDRRDDPVVRGSLLSSRLAELLRDRTRGRVVCVLNRTGRSRLLVCDACGAVAACERCTAAVAQTDTSSLVCPRCDLVRPVVCTACGSTRFRNVRAGVSRVREELFGLAGEPVGEVTATRADTGERVVVGTEAVLYDGSLRGSVGVVAFLDFDQEMLAPRYRAAEQALALLVRAARLLGGRDRGGRLVVQTRTPKHPVIESALLADPSRLAASELRTREALRLPPFAALAEVSGPASDAFLDAFGAPLGVERLGPQDGHWLLRAADHTTLCDALSATTRPPGRVRIAVDPPRA